MSTGSETEAEAAGVCGLDGCQEPLPPRPRDELGRPKGGRRARYCSKAHADLASRQRRASDLASIADPLALAKEATQGVLPVARQLSEQLTALMQRFEQAESGAFARVRAAETEAEQAHAEAARAAEAEQQAETARREALATARTARDEKDRAHQAAQAAYAEAERTRDEAWKQVADHERARGQAEAELHVARESLDLQRREHAQLLETTQEQQARITRLDLEAATAAVELRQAHERAAELGARLEETERRHRDELARAAAQAAAQIAAERQTAAQAAERREQRHQKELRRVTERAHAQITAAPRQPDVKATSPRAATRASSSTLKRRSRVAGSRPPKPPQTD
ncbi:coiled-coil domain-containing protein [Kineosporia succinea]|uniref:Chromosome segregation ATPase n=1 Tax=Kineosporia succinea TaxID=84632 RepID=A0ABT9PB49_9ACTN|nr:hypothetical protein [Kineosporia succinea]MDP9829927.1 chromosome segregation ATPase [Kineosporia succinea]